MTVAVGFNPRFATSHDASRRGATPETWLPLGTRPHQASRRDATFISSLEPWVETHGYLQGSLRDRGTLPLHFILERGANASKHLKIRRSPNWHGAAKRGNIGSWMLDIESLRAECPTSNVQYPISNIQV